MDIISAFASRLNRYSSGSTMLLHAINFIEGPSYEVIVKGNSEKSKDILKKIQQHIQPNKVIIFNNSKSKIFDFLDNYPDNKEGEPIVYVCQNYSCQLPTGDIKKIRELLE